MNALLLDTNIWIDNYDGARPSQESSRKLINVCLKRNIPLLYSASSAQNVAYIIQSSLKKEARMEGIDIDQNYASAIKAVTFAYLENMAGIATAIGMDDSDLWLARKLSKTIFCDFEDSLILAGMERSGAKALITKDEQLIKRAPYNALTPEDAMLWIEASPEWSRDALE